MRSWINSQIVIVAVQLYSRMIQEDFLPISLWDRDPGWKLVARLVLVQSRARIVLRTPTQKSFVSCLTSHFPPSLSQSRTRAIYVDGGQKKFLEARTWAMMGKHKTQDVLYRRKNLVIWRKKQGTVKKW